MANVYHSAKFAFGVALVAVLLGALPSLSWALDGRIGFDRLSLSEGLSQSNVYVFAQDEDGYLWLGTENAADRFDGYQVRSFRFTPDNPNSLTRGSVTGFLNGPLGHFWITTEYGITRFDRDTKKLTRIFETDPRPHLPLFSLFQSIHAFCNDQIIAIFSNLAWRIDPATQRVHPIDFVGTQPSNFLASNIQDEFGNVWLSNGKDLWKSDCDALTLNHQSSRANNAKWDKFGQSLLANTPLGHLAWAGADGLRLIDPVTGQLLSTIRPSAYGQSTDDVLAVATDAIGGLWLLTPEAIIRVVLDDSGLTPRRWSVKYSDEMNLERAENRPRLHVVTSGDGLIWVSVANILGVYRPNDQTLETFSHNPLDERSLPPTVGWIGYDLFVDDFGILWIGSKLGGVARYIPEQHRFRTIRNLAHPAYVVRGVGKQRIGQDRYLWIGLDDRGIELWHASLTGAFQQDSFAVIDNGHELDIDNLRIRSMATHPITGDIWFNAVRFLGKADAKDRTVTIHSRHPEENGRHRTLAFSPDGRFLYQSLGPTLVEHEFDATGQWVSARSLDWLSEKINFLRLSEVEVLSNGVILVAAEDSLFAVTPWNQALYPIPIKLPQSYAEKSDRVIPAQNQVISMLTTNDNTLWLGTEALGLLETEIRGDAENLGMEVNRVWSEDAGLPDVTIYGIEQDASGQIWASSNRGLSRINPSTSQILNFGIDDGLQAYEFNTGVVYRAEDGSLYFGGIDGVSFFQPTEIDAHPKPPIVHLEEILINDEPVEWRSNTQLSHDQNNWVLNYAGLHYVTPEHNRFAYQLEGLDSNWIEADRERVARYTGLNPGHYRFWLRSANGDGIWSEPKMLFEAQIAPPPWLSPIAYALYALLFLIALTAFLAWAQQRRIALQKLIDQRTQELQTKNELVLKQSAALQEALNARTLFFANISHELRTPLTLIDANLNTINQALPNHESVSIAQRYLQRLVRLVDQLLDLSKIRLHGVQTAISPWSLDHLLKTTLKAYEGVAREKAIVLSEAIEPDWYTRADQASIEKILLNLLTNAIKFTPKGGHVKLSLEADPHGGVWLTVADTGPGIPASEQVTIFERFHRVPVQESERVSGAGLGLALVNEAVAAIGGHLKLDTQPGKGAKFSVWLPAQQGADTTFGTALPDGATTLTPVDTNTEIALIDGQGFQCTPASEKDLAKLGTLLIVEDNKDLRDHLANLLDPEWFVNTAADGIEALEYLKAHDVDAILSDIMMPRLDGLGLLEQVRDDLGTSHIPFLFLTAQSDDETELTSLMLAADDFLRKPFDPKLLQLKLRNLLVNRKRLRTHLEKAPEGITNTSEPRVGLHSTSEVTSDRETLSPRDHRFLERLSRWMDIHFSEPELTVAGLAEAMAVDERTLQRKTRALFGQTPAYFINEYRIRWACEALVNPSLEIKEVAYRCGYTNARYFSRVFVKHRGQSPTQWRKNHQN